MRYVKLAGIIIIITVTVAVVIIGILICKISPLLESDSIFMPSVRQIENILTDNYSELSYVGKYIGGFECDYIRWDSSDPHRLTYYYEQEDGYVNGKANEIDNAEILRILDYFKNEKIEHIFKENNYVRFTRWSSLDSSCGLLYCKYDNPEITYNGDTELKELSIDNWYYFKRAGD